jgi:hypothetical protein
VVEAAMNVMAGKFMGIAAMKMIVVSIVVIICVILANACQ